MEKRYIFFLHLADFIKTAKLGFAFHRAQVFTSKILVWHLLFSPIPFYNIIDV